MGLSPQESSATLYSRYTRALIFQNFCQETGPFYVYNWSLFDCIGGLEETGWRLIQAAYIINK